MPKTASLDLRERILDCYDKEDATREQVAKRFRVSLGLVQKLLAQRKHAGDIAPRHRFSGRKPVILGAHRRQLRALLAKKPDLTLKELREAIGLKVTLPAIHYVLASMGLTHKKRRSAPKQIAPSSPTSKSSITARDSPARSAFIPPVDFDTTSTEHTSTQYSGQSSITGARS